MYTPRIYETITIGDTEYKLRITARSLVDEEKRTGKNPLAALTSAKPNEIPNPGDIIGLFFAALTPLNSNVTYNDAFDLYEEYLDDGHTYMNFVDVIINILKVSGFLEKNSDKDVVVESDEKN